MIYEISVRQNSLNKKWRWFLRYGSASVLSGQLACASREAAVRSARRQAFTLAKTGQNNKIKLK